MKQVGNEEVLTKSKNRIELVGRVNHSVEMYWTYLEDGQVQYD